MAMSAWVLGCASFKTTWASTRGAGLAEGVRGTGVSNLSSERAPAESEANGF